MGRAPGATYDTLAAAVAPWGFDLSEVRQPTHVFLGEADNLVAPGMIERLASRLPDAGLTRWPDLGHFGFLGAAPWTEVLQELARGAPGISRTAGVL
jgi:pimeloyl-ACP methyl ester carboxylesterase